MGKFESSSREYPQVDFHWESASEHIPSLENAQDEAVVLLRDADRFTADLERSSQLIQAELDQAERKNPEVKIPKKTRQEAQREFLILEERAKKLEEKVQSGIFEAIRKFTSKHKILSTAALSAMLHLPAVFDRMAHPLAESVEKFRKRLVLRPQSKADLEKVMDRIVERQKREKPGEADRVKAEIRQKMEAGESISLAESRDRIAIARGVDPKAVEVEKERRHAWIDRYYQQLATDGQITDVEFAQFSREMYATGKYEWGTGTEYDAETYNCDGIAARQLAVLEGVIARMDPAAQKRYQLGRTYIKRHVMASVAIQDASGTTERSFYLEKGIKPMPKEGQVGSATVSLDLLKKAVVSEKPLVVEAKKGTVENTPDLDVVIDNPVSDGIVVTGELRGSEFVMEEAKRRGIEVEEVKDVDPNEVVQITNLYEQDELTVERAKQIGEEHVRELEESTVGGTKVIDLTGVKRISPQAAAELMKSLHDPGVSWISLKASAMMPWTMSEFAKYRAPLMLELNYYTKDPAASEDPSHVVNVRLNPEQNRHYLAEHFLKRAVRDPRIGQFQMSAAELTQSRPALAEVKKLIQYDGLIKDIAPELLQENWEQHAIELLRTSVGARRMEESVLVVLMEADPKVVGEAIARGIARYPLREDGDFDDYWKKVSGILEKNRKKPFLSAKAKEGLEIWKTNLETRLRDRIAALQKDWNTWDASHPGEASGEMRTFISSAQQATTFDEVDQVRSYFENMKKDSAEKGK